MAKKNPPAAFGSSPFPPFHSFTFSTFPPFHLSTFPPFHSFTFFTFYFCLSTCSLFQDFQSFFDRSCDDGFFADFDDRTLEQIRVRQDFGDNFVERRFFRQRSLFDLALSQNLKRRKPRFCDQRAQTFGRKRLGKVIDAFGINVVFTKQRAEIPAGRSGRFLVNCDFHSFRKSEFRRQTSAVRRQLADVRR